MAAPVITFVSDGYSFGYWKFGYWAANGVPYQATMQWFGP